MILATSDTAYMAKSLAETESLLLKSKVEEKSIYTYLECHVPDDFYLNKLKYGGKKTYVPETDDTIQMSSEGIYIYVCIYLYIDVSIRLFINLIIDLYINISVCRYGFIHVNIHI
jgi:hypothetical protein